MSRTLKLTSCSAALMLGAVAAQADEVTFLCYQDGNECDVIAEMLHKSLLPDSIVIGGGEAKHLRELPENARRVDNNMALEGGEAVWFEPRYQL